MADDIKMPVEGSHIMMFARSVGDENPIYHDDEYAKTTEVGHIIAPPTFPRAVAQFDPDYFLRWRPARERTRPVSVRSQKVVAACMPNSISNITDSSSRVTS